MLASLGLTLALALPIGITPLLFEALPVGPNKWVLFVRDCGWGNMPRDTACKPWQRGFKAEGRFEVAPGDSIDYRGDTATLDSALRTKDFTEVWFYSSGGNLQTGVEIGRLLRDRAMTVRVPSWRRVAAASSWPKPDRVRCISSCTVAFMGGLFRYLDDGATYEVHSASSVMTDVPPWQVDLIKDLKFGELGQRTYLFARNRAIQLVTHFQNSLLKTAGRPTRIENDKQFFQWATALPRQPYTAERAAEDARRFRAEGIGTIQDILMRLERDAMDWAIEDIRALLPQLGPRGGPALKMLQAMYDVRILDTASLTRETMLSMGYLTQELEAPGNP